MSGQEIIMTDQNQTPVTVQTGPVFAIEKAGRTNSNLTEFCRFRMVMGARFMCLPPAAIKDHLDQMMSTIPHMDEAHLSAKLLFELPPEAFYHG